MYNKKSRQNYHNALANCFNNKKTKENDIARLNNIHKKVTPIQQFNLAPEPLIEAPLFKPTENIYNFNDIKISTNVQLNFGNENEVSKIPKIHLKDIVIPFQNEHDKYDLNDINNNISTTIHMNIFIGDEFNEGDVNRLKNKKVTTINHIYQQKYAHDINVTGLGDFIRGCFYILQFCNKFNFKCNILIHHPIAFFLEKFYSSYSYNPLVDKLLSENNEMFTQSNLKDTIFNKINNNIDGFILSSKTQTDFVEYLCNIKVKNNSVYSYNTLFPYDDIPFEDCNLMASLLEPTNEMKDYVDETMSCLGISKKKFNIIHIRSGDIYLKNETKIFDSLYFKTITNEIFRIINSNRGRNIDFLLIADNNEIKYLLCEVFPQIKTLYKDITHLGEGIELEREKVKNTLLDFYLISNSASVFSFTVYAHGTGFSWWCAKIYGIPYTCKYVSV
jgi:hypothetical protein